MEADDDAPTAFTGPNLTATSYDQVTLTGWGEDPEGREMTYEWVQTGGEPVEMLDANGPSPSFEVPAILVEGELTFELRVSDGTNVAVSTVTVAVDGVGPVLDGDESSEWDVEPEDVGPDAEEPAEPSTWDPVGDGIYEDLSDAPQEPAEEVAATPDPAAPATPQDLTPLFRETIELNSTAATAEVAPDSTDEPPLDAPGTTFAQSFAPLEAEEVDEAAQSLLRSVDDIAPPLPQAFAEVIEVDEGDTGDGDGDDGPRRNALLAPLWGLMRGFGGTRDASTPQNKNEERK